jgi:hypothetical protein
MVPYNMRLKFPLSLDGPLQHEAQTFRCPWMTPYNIRLKLYAVPGWYLQHKVQTFRSPWMVKYTISQQRDKNSVLSQFGN